MEDAERKAGLLAELNKIQTEFVVSDEWGIYNDAAQTKILNLLKTAAERIEADQFAEAEDALMRACLELNKSQNSWEFKLKTIWYFMNARWGIVAFLWSCVFSLGAYYMAFNVVKPLDFDESIQQPAFWGLLGAFTKSIYWLQLQIGLGTLRPRFHSYFLVAPAVGLSLGGALWLVVVVAFKLFSKGDNAAAADWTVTALIAFFGGYNWEWALKTIETMSERVRSSWSQGSK